MDILVDYIGNWGLGDLLCSDPMMLGLHERFGSSTRIWLRGKVGNVIHNPLVHGLAATGQRFDRTVEVRLFNHMDTESYGRLEAMPSLIDHMCSYAAVAPSDRRPRLHLGPADMTICRRLPRPRRPRVAICADHFDPQRHWPVERWRTVAWLLQKSGAEVVGIGSKDRLGWGIDQVGTLSMRETAALLTTCDLFAGNNSGPFHYAQAAGVPCVTLFSLAAPARFVHPGATVHAVEAEGLECLHCMTRCFAAMQASGCTATPRGRCMTDITVDRVLDAIDMALNALTSRRIPGTTEPPPEQTVP
ncbi:MAG: glycosyltransferase family 9 protein [Planctomycetes bacterium]|nr:glycosyltransferase family 9 protein [Planctomycetota bacterium]